MLLPSVDDYSEIMFEITSGIINYSHSMLIPNISRILAMLSIILFPLLIPLPKIVFHINVKFADKSKLPASIPFHTLSNQKNTFDVLDVF